MNNSLLPVALPHFMQTPKSFRMLGPWLAVACLFAGVIACNKSKSSGGNTVVAKGDRHLGIHLVPAVNSDYPTAFNLAASTGADCVPMTIQWTALEANGLYDPEGLLADLNRFYASKSAGLSLCLSPTGADKRDVPPDLMTLSFSDPLMISRFNLLLDTVFVRLKNTKIQNLLIGNEVDLYLSKNPSEWSAYGSFSRAVRTHARALWGDGLTVAVETTLGDAIGTDATAIRTIHDSMDAIALTYYPLNNDFTMAPSERVDADFLTLFQNYPVKPILLQEAGYATSTECSGSNSQQAAFVGKMFGIWDQHAAQVHYLAFLWLSDLSLAVAAQETDYYGLTGTPVAKTFTEYIRTLGLCDSTGRSKPGFDSLKAEAARRGWKP